MRLKYEPLPLPGPRLPLFATACTQLPCDVPINRYRFLAMTLAFTHPGWLSGTPILGQDEFVGAPKGALIARIFVKAHCGVLRWRIIMSAVPLHA